MDHIDMDDPSRRRRNPTVGSREKKLNDAVQGLKQRKKAMSISKKMKAT
jgi:hypothetical protein